MASRLEKFISRLASQWVLLMSGGVSVLLSALFAFGGIEAGACLFGGVGSFCLLWAFYRMWNLDQDVQGGLQAKLDAIEQARPRLEITGCGICPRKIPTGTLTENYTGGFENSFFAFVKFTNNPSHNEASAVAKRVHATILYVTKGEQVQFCENGEWWKGENPPPSDKPLPLDDIGFVEFEIGASRILSIAFKTPKEESCFGFCCHSRTRPGWRVKKLRLSEPEYEVRVTLQGEHLPKATSTFLLINPGKGRPPEFKLKNAEPEWKI